MSGPVYQSELWSTGSGHVLLTERPLAEGWWLSVTVFVREGSLVIGELRIFPGADRNRRWADRGSRRAPKGWKLVGSPWSFRRLEDGGSEFGGGGVLEHNVGEWDRNPDGRDPLPEAGMTHSVMREVRLGEILADAHTQLAERLRAGQAGFLTFPAPGSDEADALSRLTNAPTRVGRVGADDALYLTWAIRYADAVAAGSRSPIKDLAGPSAGYPRPVVRDLVHEARRRHLLSPASRGRAGGTLTDKAMRLLAHQERNDR